MDAVTTTVMRWLARRVKRLLRLASVSLEHAGGVAFQQRFDSALRLNPQLHILVADGVLLDAVGRPRLVALPSPSPDELADSARRQFADGLVAASKASLRPCSTADDASR